MRNKPVKYGLGGSVVSKLASSFPNQDCLNYHIVMDSFFTSLSLLRLLKEMGTAATEQLGLLEKISVEKAPLKSVKEMEKLERCSSDVLTENNYNIAFVRWKDNKVVTVAFT